MDELEKTVFFNKLLSIYGKLLSSTQREVLSSYYMYNLSLSEIAIERNISRAAVDDALKKGEANLLDFDNRLCLSKKIDEINVILEKLKKNNDVKEDIEKIEEVINNGI